VLRNKEEGGETLLFKRDKGDDGTRNESNTTKVVIATQPRRKQ
jgi:hypothetical protein